MEQVDLLGRPHGGRVGLSVRQHRHLSRRHEQQILSPPRRFLVQECTGERSASSSIYCTEKTIENNVFKGNKMVFVRQVGTYRPKTQFPIEWRREIETRERSLKRLMAV